MLRGIGGKLKWMVLRYHPFLNWEHIMFQVDENFSSILDHKKLIETFEVEQQLPAFQIHVGLYKDGDGFDQFGFLIVDRRFDNAKHYVEVMGANFCKKDRHEWFAQVTARQLVDTIKQSHRNTLDEIKSTQMKLDKLLTM